MFTARIALVSAALLMCVASCKHSPPPPDAATFIAFRTEIQDSIFWESITKKYVPNAINDKANYQLVSVSQSAPYQMTFRLLRADSYDTGYQMYGNPTTGYSGTKTYRTRVEVAVTLKNPDGVEVWKWTGWAEYKSPQHAIEYAGKIIAKEMQKAGLLDPQYYKGKGIHTVPP